MASEHIEYLARWRSGGVLLSDAPPSWWLALLMDGVREALPTRCRIGDIQAVPGGAKVTVVSGKTGVLHGSVLGRSVEHALLSILRSYTPQAAEHLLRDLGVLESKLHGLVDEAELQARRAKLPPSRWDF